MLNGIMVNVSESEHGLIRQSLEAMLTNVSIGTEQRLEIESLHEELSDHKATFNPETDLASRQQEQIQYLNAIIEKHENTIAEQTAMLRTLAIRIAHVGRVAYKLWGQVCDDLIDYSGEGYDPTKINALKDACDNEAFRVGMYLHNQKHDS